MATISRPTKTGGTDRYTTEVLAGFDTIKATEVDADLDRAYQTINTLDDANIIVGANINGNKIATGTLPGAKLASGSITDAQISASANIQGTKIAAGTITNTQISPAAGIVGMKLANATIAAINMANGAVLRQVVTAAPLAAQDFQGETSVVTFPAVNIHAGAHVVIAGNWALAIRHQNLATTAIVSMFAKRNAVPFTASTSLVQFVTGGVIQTIIPYPPPFVVDMNVPAGFYTYNITLLTNSPDVHIITPAAGVGTGALWLLEIGGTGI